MSDRTASNPNPPRPAPRSSGVVSARRITGAAAAALALFLIPLACGRRPGLEGGGDLERYKGRRSQELYSRHCLPCHGEAGKGDGMYYPVMISKEAPPDFTSRSWAEGRDASSIRAFVAGETDEPWPGRLCPRWSDTLDSESLSLLADHILGLKAEPPDPGERPAGG